MKKLLAVLLAIAMVFTFCFFAVGSGEKQPEPVDPTEGYEDDYVEDYDDSYDDYNYDDNYNEDYDGYSDQVLDVYRGEYVYTDDIEVTYLDAGIDYTDYGYLAPENGKVVIYLELFIENTGSDLIYISTDDFVCDVGETFSFGSEALSFQALSAGDTCTGRVYFTVDGNANIANIKMNLDDYGSVKANFIVYP